MDKIKEIKEGVSTSNVPKAESNVLKEVLSKQSKMIVLDDMPSMTGVKLVHSQRLSRRSSMFERQALTRHGDSTTLSRGSFSMKIDPVVGVINNTREASETAFKLAHLPNLSQSNIVSKVESHSSIKSDDCQLTKNKIDGPLYENSYRLDPPKKPTKKELTMMFDKVLKDVPAKPKFTRFSDYAMLTHKLSDKVIAECKQLGLVGYRFMCVATVVSKDHASAQQASRQLWDHTRDTWDEATLKLPHANIFLQVYCVYLD